MYIGQHLQMFNLPIEFNTTKQNIITDTRLFEVFTVIGFTKTVPINRVISIIKAAGEWGSYACKIKVFKYPKLVTWYFIDIHIT